MTAEERARALLDAARGRGAVKRLGAELDEAGTEDVRAALVAVARARGADLPDEAATWPGKTLLRRARGREAAARERSNPIPRDEAFTCAHCARDVPAHGRTARDHCPFCLRSLHVDVVPGDRAADCHGVLDPIAVELRHGEAVLTYRCRRCGGERVNRAVVDGDVPDDWRRIVALSAGNG